MADTRFGPSAPMPGTPFPLGNWRIDAWSGSGWTELAGFFDQASASTVLAEMRAREPETLFRVVRRIGQDAEDAPAPALGAVERPTVDRRPRTRPGRRRSSAEDPVRAAARICGTLGLVALVVLACAAHWGGPWLSRETSRSAGPAKSAESESAAPVPSSPTAQVPAPLSGLWSLGDCGESTVRFLPDRELHLAEGRRSALLVDGYRPMGEAGAMISYAGGATATYAWQDGQLRLAGARIARIEITPQEPMVLTPCAQVPDAGMPEVPAAETMQQPNTPESAFRLAVRVGDDLAATMALARGLPVSDPLGDDLAQTPLEWAVNHGRTVLVAKLAAAGADPDRVNAAGMTLLSTAVARDDAATAEALITAGADPTRPNRDGTRPIDLASIRDNQLLVDILFAASQ